MLFLQATHFICTLRKIGPSKNTWSRLDSLFQLQVAAVMIFRSTSLATLRSATTALPVPFSFRLCTFCEPMYEPFSEAPSIRSRPCRPHCPGVAMQNRLRRLVSRSEPAGVLSNLPASLALHVLGSPRFSARSLLSTEAVVGQAPVGCTNASG